MDVVFQGLCLPVSLKIRIWLHIEYWANTGCVTHTE